MSKDNDEAIGRMWERFASADFSSSIDERKVAVGAAMSEIKGRLALEPGNAVLNYYLGYLWYNWPEKEEGTRHSTYAFLGEALRNDPSYVPARMLLGFQQYDDAQYSDALATLSEIEEEKLGTPSESWQRIKLREIMLCCRLRLGWKSLAPLDIAQLRSYYSEFGATEVPPAPVEIARTLVEVCNDNDAEDVALRGLVAEGAGLIETVEGADGGAVGVELSRLKEWLGRGVAT